MIWRSSYHRRIAQAADFFTGFSCYGLSYMLWRAFHGAYPSLFPTNIELGWHFIFIGTIFSLVFVILFDVHKAYSYQRFTSLESEYSIVARVSLLAVLIDVFVAYALGYDTELRRTFFALSVLVTLVGFLAEKTLLFFVAAIVRKKGRNRKRVLLLGTGTRAKQFIDKVNMNFSWGLDIVGLLTGDLEKVRQEFYGVKVLDTFFNIERVLKVILKK